MPNLAVMFNIANQIAEAATANLRGSAQIVADAVISAIKPGTTICFDNMTLYVFYNDQKAAAQAIVSACGGLISSVCAPASSQTDELCTDQYGDGAYDVDASLAYGSGANDTLVRCVEDQIKAALCPPVESGWVIPVAVVGGVLAAAALLAVAVKTRGTCCAQRPATAIFTSANSGAQAAETAATQEQQQLLSSRTQ